MIAAGPTIIDENRWPAPSRESFFPPEKNQVAGPLTFPVTGADPAVGILPKLMPYPTPGAPLHPDRRPSHVPRSGIQLITPLSFVGVQLPAPGGEAHQYPSRPGSLSSMAGRSKPWAYLHGFHRLIKWAGPAAPPATPDIVRERRIVRTFAPGGYESARKVNLVLDRCEPRCPAHWTWKNADGTASCQCGASGRQGICSSSTDPDHVLAPGCDPFPPDCCLEVF